LEKMALLKSQLPNFTFRISQEIISKKSTKKN
jgi:hypothetical protein